MSRLISKEEWVESLTTKEQIEALLIVFRATVNEVLASFEGPGSTSRARVGDWGAWEMLCHFIRWHEATIEGMESVARGGGIYVVREPTHEENARVIAQHRGESFIQLSSQLRALHKRLEGAARKLTDPDVDVIRFFEGVSASARTRLERIPRHWAEHMAVLQNREPQ